MTEAPRFFDTAEGARSLIEWALDRKAAEALLARIDRATCRLVPDPSVPFVWGVLDTNGKARVVLYLIDGDFEADENWLGEVARTHEL